METKALNLSLAEIEENPLLKACRIPREAPAEDLPEPLWVRENDGKYRLIWGPPRKEATGESRPAILVRGSEQEDWKLTLRLWNKHRTISPLEKGLVINDLLEQNHPPDLVQTVMDEHLDLPRSDVWMDCYAGFPELPEPIRVKLHEGELDPRHIRFVDEVDDTVRSSLIGAWENGDLDLSVQETRKFMEMTRRLDDDALDRVSSMIEAVREDERDVSPRELGQKLLDDVRAMAYPRTTEQEEQFNDELNNLDINGRIRVNPPKNFEGDYLDFYLRIRRDQSLEELAEDLKSCKKLLQHV